MLRLALLSIGLLVGCDALVLMPQQRPVIYTRGKAPLVVRMEGQVDLQTGHVARAPRTHPRLSTRGHGVIVECSPSTRERGDRVS